MAITAANFIYGFFVFCITSSITFVFVCAILAWILSRVMGASIGFRVGGCNSLRDVMVKFKKGAVESISVGEIKLCLSHSLVKLAMDFSSLDPKMQLVICNLEVVTRPSTRSNGKKKTKKPRTRKSGKSNNGKWMMISNIARYLSLSVTNLVLKTPKFTIEFKELNVDLSKDDAPESDLFVRVQILPIVVHIVDPKVSCDQSSNFSGGGSDASSQTSVVAMEKSLAPSICEKFSVSCEFGHDSEMGIAIKNVDISIGEVSVNLDERILEKRKSSSESHSSSDRNISSDVDSENTKQPPKKQQTIASYCTKFPEKVSFDLPKLSVNFSNGEYGISVENNIIGVQLKITKFRSTEDVEEITHLDFHLMFSEIQLLREAGSSILELVKLDLACFVYVPIQELSPVRAEIEINLRGLQCNIIVSRLKPWLLLHSSSKKKKMVLREESSVKVKSKSTNSSKIIIIWKCNVSLPEITIGLSDMAGSSLYHGCLQSSHLFANNNTGTTVHFELGELNLHLADEFRKSLKEISFGVESNSGSILHITNVNLDWGKMDMKSSEEDAPMIMLCLSLAVNSIGVCLSFKRLEPLISTALSLKALLKSLSSSSTKKSAQNRRQISSNSKPNSGKGFQMLKFNLEQCSVCIFGETGLENTVIADPKRVNYGSQGGRVTITVSADGTPRTAKIMSTASSEIQNVNFSVSLEILHFKLCLNKEKQSVQMEIEKTKSIYEEYLEENNNKKPVTKVNLFDMQNAKFVQRSVKENVARSLFSATDITIRWEPDLQLSVIELVLRMKLLVQNSKVQDHANEQSKEDLIPKRDTSVDSGSIEKKKKKKEYIFAVDVEMLNISAEMGDGVEIMAQVQSIFSENARIGVLLEGLTLGFNGARLFKTTRIQISRIPSKSVSSSSDAKVAPVSSTTWDWVIQGLDVYVCLPFRLQLRAIDDALEDMLRALKLIIAAKTSLIFPAKKEISSKPKNPSSVKFGCVKFFIRKLTIEIEEEPIQGWLDEHYQLLKKEAGELAVRFSFLDELISKAKQDPKPSDDTNKVEFNGIEVDVNSSSSIESLREEIYKRSFRQYYQACQNLVISEGSGACSEGFQSGFKPSTSRSSLFTISASDLNVSLKMIDGGDAGMIEVLKKLDPVVQEYDIPFARLYGGNIVLNTASLAVQIRDYTYPLFLGSSGKCEGCIVLAQQATSFQPQMIQDVYVGRWRKVTLLRSLSGTTPPMKTYLDLPLHFQKGEVSFGVSYEPVFADISYAFTVALRRANLSVRNPGPLVVPPKKERSLPWWDDMRNYIHGKSSLLFSETCFNILATTDPYEKLDKLQIVTSTMEIHQSDGRILVSAKDFKILLSSLESLANKQGIKIPAGISGAFLDAPAFILEVTMDWDCDSCTPMNHFLFALPIEGKTRDKVFDPFRSTALSLRFNLSLRTVFPSSSEKQPTPSSSASTVVKLGAHDLEWIKRFWNLNYLPPHKLRTFSRWPRFGVPRIARSGNLSMDKVMTEFMIRIDSTSTCIKNIPLHDDDPSKGLTFTMNKLKFELCFGRGSKQKYTFESKRDLLVIVYEGLDFYMPKVCLNTEDCTSIAKLANMTTKSSQSASSEDNKNPSEKGDMMQKNHDDGFLLSGDYFTIRRQSPKADSSSLVAWQDAGRKNAETNNVHVNERAQSEIANGDDDTGEPLRSDPSDDDDDDGYNVVVADNCRRVLVYGLKFLWNIENRDAVVSFAGGLSKAFEPSKPSPSRQNAQRKLLEEKKKQEEAAETNQDDGAEKQQVVGSGGEDAETKQDSGADTNQDAAVETHQDVGFEHRGEDGAETHQDEVSKSSYVSDPPISQNVRTSGPVSSQQDLAKEENLSTGKLENTNNIEEGTRHFMVNVIEPQFNLHSQDAKGRFLLAAASGRVLAQSFHSVLQVGHDMIQQALGTNKDVQSSEIAWKRMEMSVMLEHVQAHVAPTDVDLGAGVQWLPKILRGSPKVKRTGALLEKVFMPCDMYFQYTRHKGGTPDLKVKPLKELKFNSHNITATMTSRHFQVMLDVLSNLLFARLPKARKNVLSLSVEDDDIVEEEVDAVVPDGIEEVELEKINFELKERAHKLILNDIRNLSLWYDTTSDQHLEKEGDLWMMAGGIPMLVQGLKRDLVSAQKSRKEAYASMRVALQKAAQVQLMEKEKNKSSSYAMRISLQIKKIVWSMFLDGKSFAEVEINDMIFDFDRDFKDVGVSQFTTKYLVFRNCLPNAKSDMLLSAWNPPPEWGKKVMLRVDARQGAPKDGSSAFEHFEVEIYPLKIHLTETMYRMMWGYFFPVEEEHDPQRRKEVWKVSTTAGARRAKKGEASASTGQPSVQADSAQASKGQNAKANPATSSNPELRRTASFDKTWEETVAESVADELVLESLSASKTSPFGTIEQDEASKNKSKDSKGAKAGHSPQEDKKGTKPADEKRPHKMIEFHNIKISQVELLITYEGTRFSVYDKKLLMDQFHRVQFTGSWQRLFSRVKKHVIWGILKSVTGMQGKKFKDKGQIQPSGVAAPETDLTISDKELAGKSDQYPPSWPRPIEGAGDGFVTSIRGLFNNQRKRAKEFVLKTMKGEEGENDIKGGEWSENDVEISPFARQLTIVKAKKLIKRHTRKLNSKGHKGSPSQLPLPISPEIPVPSDSDSSSGTPPYDDLKEEK